VPVRVGDLLAYQLSTRDGQITITPTVLDVADNSGARKISCILPLGGSTGRYAGLGDVITAVARFLESATDGANRLELFEPGELVPAFAITEAVRDRKTQAGFTWLGYDQGRIPASTLISSVPFGMEPKIKDGQLCLFRKDPIIRNRDSISKVKSNSIFVVRF